MWIFSQMAARALTHDSCQVNRGFAELISASPFLEYRLEFFSAGLVENPRSSCSLEEGRRRVKEYVIVWEELSAANTYKHLLGLQDFSWKELVPVGRGLLARRLGRSVSFVRVTCTPGGQLVVEEWTVNPPPIPFWPCAFAVHSPEDVLALVEWRHP